MVSFSSDGIAMLSPNVSEEAIVYFIFRKNCTITEYKYNHAASFCEVEMNLADLADKLSQIKVSTGQIYLTVSSGKKVTLYTSNSFNADGRPNWQIGVPLETKISMELNNFKIVDYPADYKSQFESRLDVFCKLIKSLQEPGMEYILITKHKTENAAMLSAYNKGGMLLGTPRIVKNCDSFPVFDNNTLGASVKIRKDIVIAWSKMNGIGKSLKIELLLDDGKPLKLGINLENDDWIITYLLGS